MIKKLNEELEIKVQKRTKALQEATSNIESFTYAVAHDLRAPLRAISGFTQMLKEDHSVQLEPIASDYLEKILKARTRMDRLILDLLAFIRMSREEYVPKPVDLGEVIAQSLRSFQKLIEEHHAEIIVDQFLGQVMANEGALKVCIENLISNALQFSRKGVRPRILINMETSQNKLHLCIQDNGIGIPAEYQEKIFGVFQHLERTGDLKGTGIGLALVKMAAEKMGGCVGVNPLLKKAVVFGSSFPAVPINVIPISPSKQLVSTTVPTDFNQHFLRF